MPWLSAHAPAGDRRMSANPHANGGLLLADLRLPDFREFAVDVRRARRDDGGGDARSSARGCAEVVRSNPRTFRV